MKFCPLRSNAEQIIDCSENCAFYLEKEQQCAVQALHKDIDCLSDQVYSLYDTVDNYIRRH